MRQSAVTITILIVMTLAGCVVPAPHAPTDPVVTVPDPQPEVVPEVVDVVAEQQQRLLLRQQKIARLLELADQAVASDRLMRPEEDNAFSWFQQVLALDELNADAHWGMKRITLRYLQLAEEAYQQARPIEAEQLLKSSLQVAATPAQVESVKAKYRDQLRDKVFALSSRDLRARNEQLQQQLADIALRAKEQESRLLIVASNDAEGRWIYKQMRTAVDGYRLRGNIEVGEYPRIVLIDL